MWTWNKTSSDIIVKISYTTMVDMNVVDEPKWWFRSIWKSHVPVKIILFVWIFLQNHVLTRENYKLHGGIGPSVCHLCLRNDNTTQHIQVDCEISKYIWKEVCSLLKLHDIWVS